MIEDFFLSKYQSLMNQIQILLQVQSGQSYPYTCKKKVAYTIYGHLLLEQCLLGLDKMFSLEITRTKVQIPEKIYKQLFLKNKKIQIIYKI